MPRNRVGTELPYDQKYDLPEVTKWRQLADVSMYNDLLYKDEVIAMPCEEEEPVSEFFEELKPVFYAMKIFGLFPLQKCYTGESAFRRCKISLLYSIFFYMAMNIYAYFVSCERIHFMRYSEASFDDLIYSVVHFLYVFPHFCLIPCHWVEVSKVGNYFTHWKEFQEQFHGVTGKQLCLGQARRALKCVILTPLVALVLIVLEYFMQFAEAKIWEIGFYWYSIVVLLLHVSWWFLVCCSLRRAVSSVSETFFKNPDRFAYEGSALSVAQYRALWTSLSRLTRETGYFMCYTYGHFWAFFFSVVTLSLYGSLSNIHDGLYLKHVGLAMVVCVILVLMYISADIAHDVSNEVGTEFCERLSELYSNDKQVRRELKIFSQVMSSNSTAINLGGYVQVDRGFLVRYVCTIVTYLLVLLQFRLGLLSISTTNNTMVPTVEALVETF